jgi:hypothetical protein
MFFSLNRGYVGMEPLVWCVSSMIEKKMGYLMVIQTCEYVMRQ